MSTLPIQVPIPPPGMPPPTLPPGIAGAAAIGLTVPPLPTAPPPTQHIILLTHLPIFLCDHKSLRELTNPCGASRGITVCQTPNIGCVAIVRMSTSIGATALVKAAPVVLKDYGVKAYYPKELQKRVTTGILKSTAANPILNIPFVLDGTSDSASRIAHAAIPDPPPDDPAMGIVYDDSKTLIEKMTEARDILKERQSNGLMGFVDSVRKLDVNKVAAAAGGGAYDEDIDPLNAPEVLEAVTKFKKALEERDIKNKRKRQEIVDKKLLEAVDHYKTERKRMIQQATKPKEDVKESGKRGVSNLPAWMTKEEQPKPAKELTMEMLTAPTFLSTFWKGAPLPSRHEPTLHTYITSKIKNLLGEEESTLIEFLFQNTIKSKMSPQSLIDELFLVLEDDANKFVLDLYSYIQTLLES